LRDAGSWRLLSSIGVNPALLHIGADTALFLPPPPSGREFAVRNALRDCAKSSLPKLRACVAILCETDAALKSTRTDGRIQIEMAITKMLTAKN